MYRAQRPSAVARRKRQERREAVYMILNAAVAVFTAWALIWIGYFATI